MKKKCYDKLLDNEDSSIVTVSVDSICCCKNQDSLLDVENRPRKIDRELPKGIPEHLISTSSLENVLGSVVYGNHDKYTLSGEQLFRGVFKFLLPKLMRPASEPIGEVYDFTKEEFEKYFEKKNDLMIGFLTSYTPHWEANISMDEFEKFIDDLQTYHTMRMSNDCIKKSFFETFRHIHFKYRRNATRNGRFKYDVLPTSKLYSYNKDAFEEISIFLDRLIGKKGIFHNQGICNKLKTHFNKKLLSTHTQKPKKDVVSFIRPYFKTAWILQADSNQTNATLTDASIKRLVDHLIKKEVLNNKSIFVDCGSSYGSLLLNVINLCMKDRVMVKGYGIEYATLRHDQACKSILNCISGYDTELWVEDMNFNVELVNRDLLEYSKITKDNLKHDTNGNRIMFAFDKAFEGNLLVHIALLAVNSDDIDFFVTCRETFETKEHNIQLQTNSRIDENGICTGRTNKGFLHRDLLKYLGFNPHSVLKGTTMNGGNDSGGSFYIYDVRNCHRNVDRNFLSSLWENFLSEMGVTEEAMDVLITQWTKAEKRTQQPSCYPRTENDTVPHNDEIIKYYKHEVNNWFLQLESTLLHCEV